MSRRPFWLNRGGAAPSKRKAAVALDAFATFYQQLVQQSPDGLEDAKAEGDDDADDAAEEAAAPREAGAALAVERGERSAVLRLFSRQVVDVILPHRRRTPRRACSVSRGCAAVDGRSLCVVRVLLPVL